jgi:hypothetical protein
MADHANATAISMTTTTRTALMSDYQKRTPERLIEILRSSDQNPRSWNQEAADEIASLRAQLVGCNGEAKSCNSDVPCALGALAQIEQLRAQLEAANTRISDLQGGAERYWEGRWRDADAQLASARKALTEIIDAEKEFRDAMGSNWEGDPLSDACDAARAALTDDFRHD